MLKCGKVGVCRIGPSILNADLSNLSSECKSLRSQGADYLHLDVMDGHFVPNITFGPPVVECLRKSLGPDVFIEVHMMVSEPEKWVDAMKNAGVDLYTFHIESTDKATELVHKIQSTGMFAGIAIKPKTLPQQLDSHIDTMDCALVMTVEPGFGGQKFMHDCLSKVQYLRGKRKDLFIGVDGGVGPANIGVCAHAGANMIVSGTALVKSVDRAKTMVELKEKWNQSAKFD